MTTVTCLGHYKMLNIGLSFRFNGTYIIVCSHTLFTLLSVALMSAHIYCLQFSDFKTMLRSPNKVTPRKIKQGTGVHTGHLSKQRLSVPDLDAALSDCSKDETNKRTHLKSFFTFTSKPRVKKALAKVNMLPKANGYVQQISF